MRFLIVPIHRTSWALHCHVNPASPFLAVASSLPTTTSSATNPSTYTYLSQTLPARIVAEGSKKWDELGAAQPGTWSNRIYTFGNRVLDRLEAEEWFLKEIPSLPRRFVEEDGIQVADKVEVTIPARLTRNEAHSFLLSLAERRVPYHRRFFYLSISALPASFAFTVVPGPNLPLAYNLFRIYSHWRAMHGAKTLQFLAERDALVYKVDPRLDQVLAQEDWEKGVLSESVVKEIAKIEGGSWGREELQKRQQKKQQDGVVADGKVMQEKEERVWGVHLERDLIRARNQVMRKLTAEPTEAATTAKTVQHDALQEQQQQPQQELSSDMSSSTMRRSSTQADESMPVAVQEQQYIPKRSKKPKSSSPASLRAYTPSTSSSSSPSAQKQRSKLLA